MTEKNFHARLFIFILPFFIPVLSGCTSFPPSPPGVNVIAAAPNDAQPAGSCTDWLWGWGDCNDFIAACGTGGAHVHQLNQSGCLGLCNRSTYTCHEGSEHRDGD
jgi:hypothetical protein